MPAPGDHVPHDAVLLAPVQVQRLTVDEQSPFGHAVEGGSEHHAVFAVGAVSGLAERDAVAIGEQ